MEEVGTAQTERVTMVPHSTTYKSSRGWVKGFVFSTGDICMSVNTKVQYDIVILQLHYGIPSFFPTTDINECNQKQSPCSQNSKCEDTEGSYRCPCAPGYTGLGESNGNCTG